MVKKTYEVIAWGRVVVKGDSYFLLAPTPYRSEVLGDGSKMGRFVWQPENTLKWEVAKQIENNWETYERSILVFGSDATIEFFQDPQTINVLYVIPSDEDDDNNVAVAPTN